MKLELCTALVTAFLTGVKEGRALLVGPSTATAGREIFSQPSNNLLQCFLLQVIVLRGMSVAAESSALVVFRPSIAVKKDCKLQGLQDSKSEHH